MASKLIVFAVALAACNASPVWFTGGYVPNVVYREGRAPSIAYGFGNGFSANIGGVQQSSSIGASFNTGDGEAYGGGIAGNDGNVYANGIGYIRPSAPAYPPISAYTPAVYRPVKYYNPYGANYGQAASSAQSQGYGSALAQAQNDGYGAVPAQYYGRYQNLRRNGYNGLPSAYNNGYNGIASANTDGHNGVASATNNGYGTATASSSSNQYGGTSISSTQGRDADGGYQTSIAASETSGDYRASTAQTVQQNGRAVINTSATSIDGPGIQATHSHSIKTGHY